MTIYITPDNKLHDDAEGFAITLSSWPTDARLATLAEIEAMQNPVITTEQKRTQLAPLSPAQIRLALDQLGLLAKVESAVAAGDNTLKIEWEFRQEFKRDNPTLNAMAKSLGITDDELDNIFVIGATL